MVKKLFKHEIVSYLRTLLPVNLIVLAIAIMTRVVLFFENDSIIYGLVAGSSIVMLFVGIIACIYMTFIVSIVRFYKNLFTAEVYLMFTLPVTPTQHIFVKLLTAMLFEVIAIVNIILSMTIFISGELFVEILKALGYLLKDLFSSPHAVFYFIEVLIGILIAGAYAYLLWYACISLGQRSRKNRIFMAVLAYFAYYMITQIVATVFMIVVMILGSAGVLENFANFFVLHPYASVHILLIAYDLFMAALGTLFFFIVRNTMKNKLNLE